MAQRPNSFAKALTENHYYPDLRQFRAQTWATFKLLFNSLCYSAAAAAVKGSAT